MKTCEDLKNSPYNETGVYTMDPDGSGQPVEVFCDVEKGVTEVRSHLCMSFLRGTRLFLSIDTCILNHISSDWA